MARDTRSGVAFRPCRSGSSPSSTSSDSTSSAIGSPGFGIGRAIVAHTIYEVDAVTVAQALSEIGYLLRQNEKERFRAKAFSAAAWSIAMQRPDQAAAEKAFRSEEHTSELQSLRHLVCRLLLEKKKTIEIQQLITDKIHLANT